MPPSTLVGRAGILEALTGLLDDAAVAAGSAALLFGEAGIGKTRILEEIARRAVERGFLVVRGHCTELDGVPPYWAWREVFRALDVDIGAGPAGRAAVLAALVARLDGVTQERPVLLVLEDLHWADADTRWLFRGVVDSTAGRAAAVLGSWRIGEIEDEFGELPPRVHRVVLDPLPTADTVELVREVAGGALAEEPLVRAAEQSGGNPFFARELVRMQLLGSSGQRVPRGVRDVLIRRLARLSSAAVEAVMVAAVLGTEADLPVLAGALGRPTDVVADSVDGAVRAGLVELGGASGSVGFVHAIVREVLLDQAGAGRRATLHERAALALEDLRPGAVEALALHWAQVPGDSARKRAIERGRTARDAARSASALEQAVVFAELVAARSEDPEDLLVLGDARARTGDAARSRTDLLRAVEAARAAGRVDLLARAALGLSAGEGGFEVALHDAVQVQLLDEAARNLSPGGLRARVRARQAVATSVSMSPAARRQLAGAAVAEAESAGNDRALLHALAAYADMIGSPRHVGERAAVADRMLALARRLRDVDGELLARRFRLVALLEVGDFDAADREIRAFDQLAHRTHQPGHLWYPPLWRGMQALLDGRTADAEAYADQVDVLGGQAQSGNAGVLAATLRGAVRYGSPEDLVELVAATEEYARDVPPDLPQLLVALAGLYAGLRDVEQTARNYRPLAAADFRTIPEDAEYLSGMLCAVEAAILLGDRPGAEILVGLLTPFAGLWIVDGIGAACWGVVAEWLARLADLLGRRPDATRWRGAAEAVYRRTGTAGPLRRLTGDDPAGNSAGRTGQLRREDNGWVVGWAGAHAWLPDLKGLHDLAALLSRPGEPVAALRLLAAGAGIELGPPTGADEVLDERARAAYRDRLRGLEDEIADAAADADLGRAARLRDEREFLLHELSAALGLGGRSRRLGDDADRARKAVTMRLRDVVTRLEGPLPALARHLRAALRTGRECCYEPEEPVSWQVSAGRRAG